MMGVFRVKVFVFSLTDLETTREVEMVVDTGATYPMIPRALAEELGIRPVEQRVFTLADGSRIVRDVGWAGFRCGERTAATMVVLGEADDPALLGALALEGLGLEVDPVSRQLKPTAQWLLASGSVGATPAHGLTAW